MQDVVQSTADAADMERMIELSSTHCILCQQLCFCDATTNQA